MNVFETYHADFIEDQYSRWREDPQIRHHGLAAFLQRL